MKSSPPETRSASTARPLVDARGDGSFAPAFGARIRRGLMVQMMGRGGEQGVRLVANIILARLLAPEEFGLLGMVATGVALADALAFVGTDQAVLAEPKGRRPRFLATAWCISLARGGLLGLVLLLLAAPLANWYGHPEATGLFMLIALQPILTSLGHPGAFVALRGLSFGRWTTARLAAVTLGTAVTITVAVTLRDARALVIGHLATTLLSSLVTYPITPRRLRVGPRLHRRHLGRLLRFSAQSVGTPIFIMGLAQIPVVLIGMTLGPAALGVFLMLRRVCDAGTQLVVRAISLVLVPASAGLAHDPQLLRHAWSRALRLASLLSLGVGGLLAWLGGDLPAVLLGPDFRGPSGLFTSLAITAGLATVLAVTGAFFWGLARPALDRTVQLIRVTVLAALATVLLEPLGPTGVALALAAAAFAALVTSSLLARRHIGIPLRTTAAAIAPGAALGAAVWCGGALIDLTLQPAASARLLIAAAAVVGVSAIAVRPILIRRFAAGSPPASVAQPSGASA